MKKFIKIGLLLTGISALTAIVFAQAPPPIKAGSQAPEFVGDTWRNPSRPLTISGLRGKVVLVHFWTFGCINCKHNLPSYNDWYDHFAARGLQIVGIHTPETSEERSVRSVEKTITQRGIQYPVLIDNDGKNWNRWGLDAWPTLFLIDKKGHVRHKWVGELDYDGAQGTAVVTSQIKELLAEK